jgi:hypothetical protein
MPKKKIYTMSEAARHLDISTNAVRKAIEAKRLAATEGESLAAIVEAAGGREKGQEE